MGPKLGKIQSDLYADFMALDLNVISKQLKSLGVSISVCVFKTWVNGWVTSDRLQGKGTNFCVFGCSPCEDSLSHYIWCSPLWDAVASTAPFQVSLGDFPDQRLCLDQPTARDFKTLAAAFHLYNIAREKVKLTSLPIPHDSVRELALRAWFLVALAH